MNKSKEEVRGRESERDRQKRNESFAEETI